MRHAHRLGREIHKLPLRRSFLGAAQWRIPAERMKMKEQHLVPLSTS
jgi:hypothetical protein